MFRPGTLVTIKGTSCVFMSLGHKEGTKNELQSFNGMDIRCRVPVIRCDGEGRQATRREQAEYWKVMREVIRKKEEG